MDAFKGSVAQVESGVKSGRQMAQRLALAGKASLKAEQIFAKKETVLCIRESGSNCLSP